MLATDGLVGGTSAGLIIVITLPVPSTHHVTAAWVQATLGSRSVITILRWFGIIRDTRASFTWGSFFNSAAARGVFRKNTLNPSGIHLKSFKKPTKEELSHDFLWRITNAVAAAGEIGIFDRSHYEDVLIVRVHGLAPKAVWEKRYDQIRAFEKLLVNA